MLPRSALKCLIPLTVRSTTFSFQPLVSPLLLQPIKIPLLPFEEKRMPTQLLRPEQLEQLSCGTGNPAQRGRRKPLVWKRRKPWFDHQWSLELQRVKKGPNTPHFPDGVPFTQIRSFQSFSGRSWKINAGRRRKIRLSLKRGRRKLL